VKHQKNNFVLMKKITATFLVTIVTIVILLLGVKAIRRPAQNPTAGWKTLSDLDYSLKYPPTWFYSEKKQGSGIKILANFQTSNCIDENGFPINPLVEKSCVTLVVSQQVSGFQNLPLSQYINRQFGQYDSETKIYNPVKFEALTIQGNEAAKLMVNNNFYYLLRKGNTLFQISLTPANSQLLGQFELMLSTIRLFSTE